MTTTIETPKSGHKKLTDFYLEYPHKKVDYATSYPYVPKKDLSTHKNALTFKEWSKVIKTFYKYVLLYLAEGFTYRFSSAMGELRIVKYKSKTVPPDYNKIRKLIMKEKGCNYAEAMHYITKEHVARYKHLNKNTDGYRWKVAWFKGGYKFKYQRYWTMVIDANQWKKLNPIVAKNIHKISLTEWIMWK